MASLAAALADPTRAAAGERDGAATLAAFRTLFPDTPALTAREREHVQAASPFVRAAAELPALHADTRALVAACALPAADCPDGAFLATTSLFAGWALAAQAGADRACHAVGRALAQLEAGPARARQLLVCVSSAVDVLATYAAVLTAAHTAATCPSGGASLCPAGVALAPPGRPLAETRVTARDDWLDTLLLPVDLGVALGELLTDAVHGWPLLYWRGAGDQAAAGARALTLGPHAGVEVGEADAQAVLDGVLGAVAAARSALAVCSLRLARAWGPPEARRFHLGAFVEALGARAAYLSHGADPEQPRAFQLRLRAAGDLQDAATALAQPGAGGPDSLAAALLGSSEFGVAELVVCAEDESAEARLGVLVAEVQRWRREREFTVERYFQHLYQKVVLPTGAGKCSYAVCAVFQGVEGGSLRRCARCQHAAYCSRECQAADWRSGHKKRCALVATALSPLAAVPDDFVSGEAEAKVAPPPAPVPRVRLDQVRLAPLSLVPGGLPSTSSSSSDVLGEVAGEGEGEGEVAEGGAAAAEAEEESDEEQDMPELDFSAQAK